MQAPKEDNPVDNAVRKGQTEPRICWIVGAIWQTCHHKRKAPRWFTVSDLRGGSVSGNRECCDVVLFKLKSMVSLFGHLQPEWGLENLCWGIWKLMRSLCPARPGFPGCAPG